MVVAQYNFNQHFYASFLQRWLLIFINDCIDCQMSKKDKKQKTKQAAILPFTELSNFFNHSISIDTKDPVNPACDIYVSVGQFCYHIVTVPTPKQTL